MCSASEVGGVFGGQAGRGVVGARFPLDGSKHYLGMHLRVDLELTTHICLLSLHQHMHILCMGMIVILLIVITLKPQWNT